QGEPAPAHRAADPREMPGPAGSPQIGGRRDALCPDNGEHRRGKPACREPEVLEPEWVLESELGGETRQEQRGHDTRRLPAGPETEGEGQRGKAERGDPPVLDAAERPAVQVARRPEGEHGQRRGDPQDAARRPKKVRSGEAACQHVRFTPFRLSPAARAPDLRRPSVHRSAIYRPTRTTTKSLRISGRSPQEKSCAQATSYFSMISLCARLSPAVQSSVSPQSS